MDPFRERPSPALRHAADHRPLHHFPDFGVFLFVKIGGPLKGIHEWLSMVLIAPFVLHLWRNWRPFMAYFKRTPMIVAIVISVALTVPFFLDSGSWSVPPYVQFSRAVLKGTPAELAPVLECRRPRSWRR